MDSDFNTDDKPRKRFKINWWTVGKVCLNLLAMFGVVMILGWLAMTWMDSWTHHGEVEVVPDLKGLSYNEAVARLDAQGLNIELSDSMYDEITRPGTVLDQNPKGNTKVKPGRIVYVTINAFSPKTVTVPFLTDISLRQAQSVLEGLGIKNIKVVKVMSEFKDLVISAKCNGRPLKPGARVSVNSVITLEVGEGLPDIVIPSGDEETTGEPNAIDAEILDPTLDLE